MRIDRTIQWLLGLTCLLTGCMHQELATEQWRQGETTELHIGVTRAVPVPPDEVVTKLRLIAFRSRLPGQEGDGRLVLNVLSPDNSSFTQIVPTGYMDFYFIANEPTDLSAISTVDQLKAAVLTYTPEGLTTYPTPTPIPMFAQCKEVKAVTGGKTYVGGVEQSVFTLERLLAKVSVKLNVKNSNFLPGCQVTVDRVQVKQLPQQSYWLPQPYAATTWMNSIQQTATTITPASGFDTSWENTFYVPEYLLTDPDKGAYVEITAHQADDLTAVTYKVPIGNAMDNEKKYGDRYDLTRNRHYAFTGNIKGYGNADLELKLTVNPWTQVPVGGEVGDYIMYEKVTEGTSSTTALTEPLLINNSAARTVRVWCNTNVGDWRVVVKDGDAIISTSDPTPAVTSPTLQTITVTLPAASDIYQIIELQACAKKQTIQQVFSTDGSIIPHSVLEAAGWPSPPRGLQVATRGNKVLPGGTAAVSDPTMQWKTEATSTSGTTAAGLGMGKSNTDAMIAANIPDGIQHPAANYCREMGAEWYMPSIDELMLICVNGKLLGSSYTFVSNLHYWCSTEYESGVHGRFFIVSAGGGGGDSKNKLNPVRCVRNL